MRFYTQQHPFSCGIDCHARPLSVCLLKQAGEIRCHRQVPARPEALLTSLPP
jgi:hypothetical protein